VSELTCPVCGSNNIVKSSYKEFVHDSLCGQVLVEKTVYHCNSCGEEGDFFNDNDKIINETLEIMRGNFVASTLDTFVTNKISFSSMERALDLPQRTLTKWKNGVSSPTAVGIALLKYLRLFPWLLEVAENDFEYETSQKIFMMTAFNKMINKMSFYENEFKEAGIFTTANSAFLYIHVQKKDDARIVSEIPMVSVIREYV
jgi:hypothetical protein